MGVDLARLKKPVSIVITVGCILVFALGVMAFVVAMRPCHLSITPGELVNYRLVTTTNELSAAGDPGPSQVDVRELQLIGTGPDNEAALISPAADGDARHDEVCLLDFSPDGAAFELDAGARPQDMGVAIGFFDFNLLPLPEGAEQPRDVTINYAVIPTVRNPVQGRVRRIKSGSKPTFQLKLQQSVEWVGDGIYHQIHDLVASYRFNTALGVVDKASIDLIAGVEGQDVHKYRISMTLELEGGIGHTGEDARHLREQVLDSAEAQQLLAKDDDHQRSAEAAEKLRAADIDLPQLRALADHLCQAILNPAPVPDSSWSLVVASGAVRDYPSAQQLQRQLVAAGFPSQLLRQGADQLQVVVGPYASRDPGVSAALSHSFPQFTPQWVAAP